MDIHKLYQNDNKFAEDEKSYYILTGKGGSARKSNTGKYYIITCTLIAGYAIEDGSLLKKIGIISWPISVEDHKKQDANSEYFNTYQDGVIYKIKGRVQYNYFGDASILYVKEVTECDVKGTKLDKRQEKYRAPILLDDDVLGHLILEKSKGLFEGKFNYNENEINIYIEVEWDKKRTWKKPFEIARAFISNIDEKNRWARKYIVADEELFESALEYLEEDCEMSFSTPDEFFDELQNRMKYVFVNQDGSYVIGYDDGYLFGGHEIDVDIDSNGTITCVEMR